MYRSSSQLKLIDVIHSEIIDEIRMKEFPNTAFEYRSVGLMEHGVAMAACHLASAVPNQAESVSRR